MTGMTVDSILDFAIQKEEDAARFYTDLAEQAENPAMAKALRDFAREEEGHKAKLQKVKSGGKMLAAQANVADLKIAEYTVEADPQKAVKDYQQALVLAMQQEKASYKLYMRLAQACDDAEVREVLLGLANEEAKHKLRFEIEYDDNVLIWN